MRTKIMISLEDFVSRVILEIKEGVDDFNRENDSAKAGMPDSVTLEVMVDNECIIGGPNKLTITIPLSRYNPACNRNKE